MGFGEKIGEGKFRTVHAIEGRDDLCAKFIKDRIVKRYFGHKVSLSRVVYEYLKFGTYDVNTVDLMNMNKLPDELRQYLPEDAFMKDGVLFMTRERDFDGRYSKTLAETGVVDNVPFWDHIDGIIKMLDDNQLYFMDMFWGGKNLIVKRVSEDEWVPVLIDFKHLGRTSYPLQFNLLFLSEQRKKFIRKLDVFRETYQIK